MILAQLKAFAWLRWRLLLNGVRGGRRRDTLEQISRVLALVAPAMVVALSIGSIIALGVGGWLAGLALSGGGGDSDVAALVLRAVLLAQFLLVAVMPLGLGSQSASRYTRLLLLPVPHRVLHFTEVAAGIADPWVFAVVPGLLLLVASLLVAGAPLTAVLAALAAGGFVVTLVATGALTGFLTAWLMRDRRRAEWTTLLFVIGLSTLGLLPQMLAVDVAKEERAGREFSLAAVERALPAWTRVLPSEMAGRAVMLAAQGDRLAAVGWAGGLWVVGGAAFLLSSPVHRRLLLAGEGRSRRQAARSLAGLGRMPLVSADVSAVAMAQWRSASRSLRGRLAVLFPGPMVALVAVVVARASDDAPWMARIPEFGHLVFGAGLLMALMALQPIVMNQFATDRAGLTLQWLLPIESRALVWGKALGAAVLYLSAVVISGLMTLMTTPGGSWWLWASVAVGGLSAYVAMTPVAALLSTVFPVHADLSKTGSSGNPHGAAALAGTLLTLLVSGPPMLIVVLAPRWSDGLTLALSGGWLAFVVCGAIPLLALAARVVTARRENLFLTVR